MKYISILLLSLSFLACQNERSPATDDHGHTHSEEPHDHDAPHDHDHESEGHSHDADQAETHLHTGEEGHKHAGEDEHAHESEEAGMEAHLTQEQIEKIDLKLGRISMKNLRSVLRVNGVLALPPQNMAHVSPLMEGQVRKIYVKPGAYIKKDGALASLQNPAFVDLQQAFFAARTQRTYLEKAFTRQQALVSREAAAQKELERIEAEWTMEKSKVLALEKKLNLLGVYPKDGEENLLSYLTVRSPIAGFVGEIHTHMGEYIQTGKTMFEIVDNHHIHLDLKVFEKDLSRLHIGQELEFALQHQPGKLLKAKVFSLGKSLDPEDRSVTVHAEMDNKDRGLLPGMYVEARIITEDQKVASLPESALTFDKGLEFIFVKEEVVGQETHFRKVQVLTGSRDIGFVEVTPLEKLASDAEIVIEGAFFLMAQTKKEEGGGGHHH